MKVIYNNLIPFSGYRAMMLFGTIFARKKYKPISPITINHEKIHRAQAKEMGGYVWFYLAYLWQWLRYGYANCPFEKEAYKNAQVLNYLNYRPRKAWKNYK